MGAYRSGYNYIMNVETILYDKNKTTMFETKHYDQAWTLPSFNRYGVVWTASPLETETKLHFGEFSIWLAALPYATVASSDLVP